MIWDHFIQSFTGSLKRKMGQREIEKFLEKKELYFLHHVAKECQLKENSCTVI